MIPRRRAGVTLAEAVVCVALVGIVTTGALNAVGVAARLRVSEWERTQGTALAAELIEEMATLPAFERVGVISGALDFVGDVLADVSASSGPRNTFTQFEDYDGWRERPPQTAAGDTIPGLDTWARAVEIRETTLTDLASGNDQKTTALAATVRVYRGRKLVAELLTLRTRAGVAVNWGHTR